MAQIKMGIGTLGDPKKIIKRKFRWTLRIDTPVGTIPVSYVKLAARPQLDIDELELNFLNATTWIPGKAKWQPLNVTYIDVATTEMKPLYDWIATIHDFSDSTNQNMFSSEKEGWNATALLAMYDGCGATIEEWELGSVWPQSINFGDVDYASSEEATIDLTLRYSEVKYRGICGPSPTPQCKGCT